MMLTQHMPPGLRFATDLCPVRPDLRWLPSSTPDTRPGSYGSRFRPRHDPALTDIGLGRWVDGDGRPGVSSCDRCQERTMTCPQCQRDNEEDATFCTNCGSRLERLCPKCQTPNITVARFCKRCGQALTVSAPVAPPKAAEFPAPHSYTPKHLAEKILVSRTALEGERKQVTVLFVDVSGFTSLSERLDPEDVH